MTEGLWRELAGARIVDQHTAAIGSDHFDGQFEDAVQQLVERQGWRDGCFGDAIQHLQIGERLRRRAGFDDRRCIAEQLLADLLAQLADDAGAFTDVVSDKHFQLICCPNRASDCGLLKQECRGSDGDLIAVGQLSSLNRLAVDERTVGALPVADDEPAGRLVEANLGVCT